MFDLEIDGPVATIWINRGDKANAVPLSEWGSLEQAVSAANISRANLIVLRSSLPGAFCAGADLTELERLATDVGMRRRFRGAMVSVFKRIRSANKPTIAIVNGRCFGTGVSIAMACDVRVGGPEAMFAITPARFGISYPQEEVERLVSIVGFGQAARLLYSCEKMDLAEARRIGLVEFEDRSENPGDHFIQSVATNVPGSLLSLKASLLGRAGTDKRFDDHFESRECNSLLRNYSDKPVNSAGPLTA